MESGNPAGDGCQSNPRPSPEWNFGFAFNDSDFSDRVLRIEIMHDSDGRPLTADFFRNPKRRRIEFRKEKGGSDDVVEVKTIHVSSPILAAKSPFFYKSFRAFKQKEPFRDLTIEAILPLINAARLFIANRYNDLTTYQEEVLNLPLPGIVAVLASDDLQVDSEDDVFEFLLQWSRLQYPKVEERQEIIGTILAKFVRFPHMTCMKLRKVMSLVDFDHHLAKKYLVEALFFKAEPQCLVSKRTRVTCIRERGRAYKCRPVRVVELELPHPQCGGVVYLDLKREECVSLYPAGRVCSHVFHLGCQSFSLSANCTMDPQNSFYCFGLHVTMQEKGTESISVDYDFASKSKPSQEYTSQYKGTYSFTEGKVVGHRNLFGIPWTAFVAEDCPFFINGILHLRVELTIRH